MPILSLNNIRKTLAGTCLISDFSLSLSPYEALCLKGPSGIGKTTFLEIAAKLAFPDSGTVTHGTNKLACVLQDDALVPWLSAQDNIRLILQGAKAENIATAKHWLQRFDLPCDQPPTQMSGGMRRRLSLARAFASDPGIMFLDEPFAFLDPKWQETTTKEIEAYRAQGGAILMVSHQLDYLHEIHGAIISHEKAPLTNLAKCQQP